MTMMAYSSGYLFVFAAVAIAVSVATRASDWAPRAGAVLGRLSLAAAASAIAILPVWLPYRRVAHEQGMLRSLDAVREFSATARGYLASSGRLHLATWSGAFFKDPVDSFFPGFVVAGLTLVALWMAARRGDAAHALTRRRVIMLSGIAMTGFVLSLGTRTPVYGWLYTLFPPMQGLRAAARFGNLFLLAMSALAGLGLAALRRSLRSSRLTTAAAAALVVMANAEALRAPFVYQRFERIPRVYDLLVNEPAVVLVEVPFYPRQAVFKNGEYVLNSTAHWRPLMNGYSGYTPATYAQYANAFWYFPRDYAIDAMRRAGVTHVMVHPDRFGGARDAVIAQLGGRRDLELLAVGAKGVRLYRLE
jgi:hypothetical protein